MKAKFHKIFVSIFLVLCMALSFVACGKKEDNSGVESIEIPSTLAINVGEESTLQAALMPFGVEATIKWRSSDKSIATVSETGLVKGIAAGSTLVRASVGDVHADCLVLVDDPASHVINVTKISFNNGVVRLDNVGDTVTLEPVVEPENATDKSVTFVSNKTSVATVDQTGKVTAVKNGTAVITAIAKNKVRGIVMIIVGDEEEADVPLYVKKVASLANNPNFIMGMDASAVPSLEAAGVKYKNFDGEEEDVYKILKDNGITDIRIRVWNDPYKEGHGENPAASEGYGGGNCDVKNAVAIATRCKEAGLGVIIDFHYSDFWADPGKQILPKAWKNFNETQIEEAIGDFTTEALTSIKNTGVKITMVQIGNETTSTICGASIRGATAAKYLNAGAAAVRSVTGTVANGGAKVAVHLTNPEKAGAYDGFASAFKANGVDYDVFGSSYYPFWHGTLDNLSTVLSNIKTKYNKDVMVLETSYCFTTEDFDGAGNTTSSMVTEPVTVQGQTNQIVNVIETVSDIGGLGVCYWEGTWTAATTSNDRAENIAKCSEFGCGWASAKAGPSTIGGDGYQANDVTTAGGVVIDNQAFFKPDGTPLKSLQLFKLAKTGQDDGTRVADYLYNAEVYCTVNVGSIELPSTVKVVLNDGSIVNATPIWDADMSKVSKYINTVGDYPIVGTTQYGGTVSCMIYVQNPNILKDGSFEDTAGFDDGISGKKADTDNWKFEYTGGQHLALYVCNKADNAKMGSKSFHFWDDAAIEFKLYQTVDLAALRSTYGNGTFGFSFDIMGGLCGDEQEIYAYAEITYNNGTPTKIVKGNNVSTTVYGEWFRTASNDVTIDDTVASVKIGIYVKVAADGWGNIDSAQFFKRPEA